MDMGVPAEKISLSSQELPGDFAELVKMGVKVNAW
jgi:diaminopimelate decarboxylase